MAGKLLLFLLFPLALFAEDPWGPDASLYHTAPKPKAEKTISPGIFIIQFHQQILSEADGPRSHFYPSSSEYMKQAIYTWGGLQGYLLGCDRLLRENNDPWLYKNIQIGTCYRKYDPVPLPK